MKVLQLELLAFGAFQQRTLDFSNPQSNFHIIYGKNEAGKSTTLRALNAAFFGFPARLKELNGQVPHLGARLLSTTGEELYFFRRKGRKHALTDEQKQPLDTQQLQHFFGQMNENQYNALFSLDHPHLIQGGEDLLQGSGDVGKSLFEAGSGSLRLHQVLEELDQQSVALFKSSANARKPIINQKINSYKSLQKQINADSLSVQNWNTQEDELSSSRQQHKEFSKKLRQLRTEQHRINRIKRTLPLLQRHQQLTEHLAQLETVIILPEDTPSQRIAAHSTLTASEQHIHHASQQLQNLTDELNILHIPQQLLTHKNSIDDLRGRLGSHQKAARDLPGVRSEKRTIETEAQHALKQLYSDIELQQLPQLDYAQREQLKNLADTYPALQAKQQTLLERIEEYQQYLQTLHQTNTTNTSPPNLTQIQSCLGNAVKAGDTQAQIQQLSKATTRAKLQLDIGVKQLGLWEGDVKALETLALPVMERIDNFDRRFAELENDKQRLKERLSEVRQQHTHASEKLEALHFTAGDIPSEEELMTVRQQRDQYWQRMKDKSYYQPEALQRFEQIIAQADDMADRLRREAHRVAEQATLKAEVSSTQHDIDTYTRKWRHLHDEREPALQQEWLHCWEAAAIQPWTPNEMRGWLNDCLRLRNELQTLREKQQELDSLTAHEAQLFEDLKSALSQQGNTAQCAQLNDLIEYTQAYISEIQAVIQKQNEVQQKQNETHQKLQQLRHDYTQANQALTQWRMQWGQVLRPLRLSADTAPDVARNVLDTLSEINTKLTNVQKLQRRIEKMEADAVAFHQDVSQLLNQLNIDISMENVELTVNELARRLTQAEKDATRYEQLEKHIADEQQNLTQAQSQYNEADALLNTLLTQAQCENIQALERAEQASLEKQALQRQHQEVEQNLAEQGDGLSLKELAQAAAEVDIDQLPEQLQAYTEQIETLENEREHLTENIGEQRTLLKQMNGNAKAAQMAMDAQNILAEIQDKAEEYTQVKLAATVLRQAIDTYRAQHQAPLLHCASELFQRLTLGRFSGLDTDYKQGDTPVLVGIQADTGECLTTKYMSEGTRDQLFLALRLASIEQYLLRNAPLPLVLDDILINFDDERAAASLQVLAELSQKTQILFFTHHERLVELAQQHLTTEQFVTYRL